jgi:hypothetical protein
MMLPRLPLVAALALSASACGDDDDSDLCPETDPGDRRAE